MSVPGARSRPAVSVVMPFAGTPAQAAAAAAALRRLRLAPDDELILADNSGTAGRLDGVRVVPAPGEASPARARNAGAAAASGEWVLFIDADTEPDPGLLDAYFAGGVGEQVGALAGEIAAESGAGDSLAERYGAARGFLGLGVHLAHPYMARAAAANLLVRRRAFLDVGGFLEGVRAAEDTDFCWRLQRAGWRLEPRPQARVAHRYRPSLGELRRQWRGYAAGRAWLARRYPDFAPEPAVRRAARRGLGRLRRSGGASPGAAGRRAGSGPTSGARERVAYLALDAVLGVEELAGFALSNRPRGGSGGAAHVEVVLVADRFPVAGDPLADYARSLGSARVEAAARPERIEPGWGAVRVSYREDDGALERVLATLWLVLRHPWRAGRDRVARGVEAPRLLELAPVVRRLGRDPEARVRALGGAETTAVARRLATLAGRSLQASP